MRTKRDWKILVSVFGLLCILVIAANLYFIYRLNQGTLFMSSGVGSDSEILRQKSLIQKVNAEFQAKATQMSDFETTKPVAVDPSL